MLKGIFRISLLFLFSFSFDWGCTTFIITKGASKDGSVLVGHTDDDEEGDQRIVYVPAQDHDRGTLRAIHREYTNYPRYVGKERSEAYDVKDQPLSEPVGYIEEVGHTYAYFDGNYGIINEHQLAVGECTNSSYFYYDYDKQERIMGISELSRIALERCKKAKDAVLLVGSIAEKYGYYGWGETLLFGDTEEGWVFEISCSPDGKGAIWVAKKVFDGEIFVAANQFRIQDVSKDDPDMLYSKDLFSVAEKMGWCRNEASSFNWLKAVCPGEFDHPYYSLRRVWRFFSLAAPSKNLSPWVADAYTQDYPFSIKPDEPITLKQAFSLFRDHYEGTEFDLTKGRASGAYGSPNRYLGNYDRVDFPNKQKERRKGAWERPISIYYTGYSYITQSRGWLPNSIGGIAWIGYDEPYLTCYMPFYCGVFNLPDSFEIGNPQKYDDNFAWWPFNLVANWIAPIYNQALGMVLELQESLEQEQFKLIDDVEKQALEIGKKDNFQARRFITRFCLNNADHVIKSWKELFKVLIAKYNDGYVNIPKIAEMVGYPDWYLKMVDYSQGPTSYKKN